MNGEAIRYQWYTGYDRRHEYGKNPDWSSDLKEKWEDTEEDYKGKRLRIYDKYDPEHIWMRSERHIDLMDYR